MKYGFIKTAAVTPEVSVGNCSANAQQIIQKIVEAEEQHVRFLVFPELCLTGYTCGDLFLQTVLHKQAERALAEIAAMSRGMSILVAVGAPLLVQQKLYNCGVMIFNGDIIGVVPKTFLPNYTEFYEARHFTPAPAENRTIRIGGREVPFGNKLLFQCQQMEQFCVALEVCEDLWVPNPCSVGHALAGAVIIGNLSASNETVGKDSYRRELVCGQSARLLCGYIYADAGAGESTTDMVYSGHNLIAENGALLEECLPFDNGMIATEIDVMKLGSERTRMNTFAFNQEGYQVITFDMPVENIVLSRFVSPQPFIPHEAGERRGRCRDILNIQAAGLERRVLHTGCKRIVLGLSGGLDSTLALIVAVRVMDALGRPRQDILAVTMPCFGTTGRTRSNAELLAAELGVEFREIPVRSAVEQHFSDIGHDGDIHDITYENCQARERTQVLMDLANMVGGIVLGTGDLSELALGWATYNGDHMSMYAVNASVPKTLVRHLVAYTAQQADSQALRQVLTDILDTPVSPELLPANDGEIAQKTEELVGPYELHDFFLFYILRFGFSPKKVYYLAAYAFTGVYEKDVILRWLKNFYRRFFSQQFKRSCMPDGVKVGTVSLSPRGDWRMPSDASSAGWLEELDTLEPA